MATENCNKTLIVLLGNENDSDGKLRPAAEFRAREAIALLKKDDNSIVIPTGTFGEFNKSNKPHGELLAEYLRANGIAAERILPHTKSTNTLEDAYAILHFLQLDAANRNLPIDKVVVITSAFHMDRVKYIFGRVLQDIPLVFEEAPNPASLDKDNETKNAEAKKLAYLKKTWVNVEGFDLNTFPSDSYNNAASELRHYDNLSQFALTGAAVLFGLAISGDLKGLNVFASPGETGSNPAQDLFQAFIPLFTGVALSILIFLYHKFADTAASSRRVLYTIERLYHVPGLSSTRTQTRFLGISLGAQKAVDWLYYLMVSLLLLIFIAKLAAVLNG